MNISNLSDGEIITEAIEDQKFVEVTHLIASFLENEKLGDFIVNSQGPSGFAFETVEHSFKVTLLPTKQMRFNSKEKDSLLKLALILNARGIKVVNISQMEKS